MKSTSNKPPHWAHRILNLIPIYREQYFFEDDLLEEFHEKVEARGLLSAKTWYIVQVLNAVRFHTVLSVKWSFIMLKNYLITAARNFSRNKGYSLINIAGLAIGLACCILIMLFVNDEMSYDRFHENRYRIYRLTFSGVNAGQEFHFALCPTAAPVKFAQELPDIESFARIFQLGTTVVTSGGEEYEISDIFLADSTFLDIFSHTFLAGSKERALVNPGTSVITRSLAEQVFGAANPEDAIGKSYNLPGFGEMTISGVVEDVPHISHYTFTSIVSMSSIPEGQQGVLDQWISIQGWAYLLLTENTDYRQLEAKLPEIVERHAGEVSRNAGLEISFALQKLTDIYLKSQLRGEIGAIGNIKYIYVFTAIALFILIIACINFINLTTARSSNRAREVGMRKVFGAYRSNLVRQFISESVIFALLSLVTALIIVFAAIPYFNIISGKELAFGDLVTMQTLSGLVFLVITAGFVAGSYPAFILSAFRPVAVLRGPLSKGSKSSVFRKLLVMLQFSISISLIICTLVVVDQIQYMKNMELGFNKEQVLVVSVQEQQTVQNYQTVKQELMRNPNINSVSFSSFVPGSMGEMRLVNEEGKDASESITVMVIRPDHDFVSAYEMEMAAGRSFSVDFPADSNAYMINEAAAKELGWTPEEAIGKRLAFQFNGPVVGVIKDFHITSLQESIAPVLLILTQNNVNYASMRISTQNVSETVAFITQKWNEYEPGREFEYYFVDEQFADLYSSEERLSTIFRLFASFAIFIACLGLLGLASFTAEQKTREIGLRKVLGATDSSIVMQLSKEFVRWVLLANLIAWPVSWYFMNDWLQNFAYRTSLGAVTFLLSGISAIIIALITVSGQSFKAARANVIDSIRCE